MDSVDREMLIQLVRDVAALQVCLKQVSEELGLARQAITELRGSRQWFLGALAVVVPVAGYLLRKLMKLAGLTILLICPGL